MRLRTAAFVASAAMSCGAPSSSPGPAAFSPDFKTSTSFFTFMKARAPAVGNSPHGFVSIFYSSNARDALERAAFPLPTGTVAIKEQSRSIDGSLEALTVMVKSAEGWRFETYSTDMAPLPTSQTFCGGCHQQFTQTDELGGTHVR